MRVLEREKPALKASVSVMLSCRSDDALMIPEMANWCKDGVLTLDMHELEHRRVARL